MLHQPHLLIRDNTEVMGKKERSSNKKKTKMTTSSVVATGTDTTSTSATKVNDYSVFSYNDEAAATATEDPISSHVAWILLLRNTRR